MLAKMLLRMQEICDSNMASRLVEVLLGWLRFGRRGVVGYGAARCGRFRLVTAWPVRRALPRRVRVGPGLVRQVWLVLVRQGKLRFGRLG
jgi:hypothetical protein